MTRARAALLLVASGIAPAQGIKFFNRSDPKVQTLIFIDNAALDITDRRIGIFPFPASPFAAPSPAFGEVLHQSILAIEIAGQVVYLDNVKQEGEQSETERIAAAARYGRALKLDLVMLGRVDSLSARSSGALNVKITLRIISTRNGEVLWYGVKKVDWIRRYPIEDCLRLVAESFLEEF